MQSIKLGFLAIGLLLSFVLEAQQISSIETVVVEGGTFFMGSDKYTASHEGPAHPVTLHTFRMATVELTKGEFKTFVDATGYLTTSETGGGAFIFAVAAGDGFFQKKNTNWRSPNLKQAVNQAVVAVSWLDAVHFCNWRSQHDTLKLVYTIDGDKVMADFSANGWRLPTEAEWEYAARGGKLSKGYRYSGSDAISEVAWCCYDSGWNTHAGKLKKPNEIGLYDMTGNVDEWCWDWYGPYSTGASSDPVGPDTGLFKIQRGGNWYTNIELYEDPRNTTRDFSMPKQAYNTSGIRLVRNE